MPPVAVSVNDGYFATIGAPIVRGRAFGSEDRDASLPVAIVNEWVARNWWPGRDPIGKTFHVDTAPGAPKELTVVGVVRDNMAAQQSLLLAEPGPEIYRPYEQALSPFVTFYIRTSGRPAALIKPLRATFARLVPDRPMSTTTIDDRAAQQFSGVRLDALQTAGFAGVGLFLAILGVYGVLSYSVGQRTREIAIRGALGAGRVRLAGMVIGDALRLTAIGLVVGLGVAGVGMPAIRGLLHGTSAHEPLVYGAVALAITIVVIVASYIPARSAARTDPAVTMRAI